MDLADRQHALHQASLKSHNDLNSQQSDLRAVQQNQRNSLFEYAGGHHQLRRDVQQQVSHAGEENAHAVQNLRSDVDRGFQRTENALVDQDERIRIRPREVLSAVEI